ncbi:Inositol-pentakisphosphate 2-kinase, partial [Cucurbita argyrosperma subsp. argyrosperma]
MISLSLRSPNSSARRYHPQRKDLSSGEGLRLKLNTELFGSIEADLDSTQSNLPKVRSDCEGICRMKIVLVQEYAADWTYRCEEVVNLVLAYLDHLLFFLRMLYGYKWIPLRERFEPNGFLCTDCDAACQIYVQHVMILLLDSNHVDAEVHVLVSREFLKAIEKNVLVSAGRVNVHRDSFLLQSDHSIFLKLKYGCLPTSRFITKRNFIKQNVTRFRMHQALKLQNGEISELRYMPTAIHFDYKKKLYQI